MPAIVVVSFVKGASVAASRSYDHRSNPKATVRWRTLQHWCVDTTCKGSSRE
jgi:hypothetical protein